jgi:hypothetical protein
MDSRRLDTPSDAFWREQADAAQQRGADYLRDFDSGTKEPGPAAPQERPASVPPTPAGERRP